MEEGCSELAVFKQEVYVDQVLRLSLYPCSEGTMVYSKGPVNYDAFDSSKKRVLRRVELVDRYNEADRLKPGQKSSLQDLEFNLLCHFE